MTRLTGALAISAATTLAGCDSEPPPAGAAATPSATTVPASTEARGRLAARTAAAKDLRYAALYRLKPADDDDGSRSVVVTRARDGGWRVDIARGALGGTADVSVARTAEGLFQCSLASADRLVEPTCVRVGDRDASLDADIDPQVQHVFVDWLEVLTDRDAAIAVSTAPTPEGVAGACFSVESNSASLTPPIDVGIYCYAEDGMLTRARLGFGTLTLDGDRAPAPERITLPGPVVDEDPLPMASPPPPPTPTDSAEQDEQDGDGEDSEESDRGEG